MDPEAQLVISRYLDGGESLLWSGRPRHGLAFRRGDIVAIPFSLFWCGGVTIWIYGVLSTGVPFMALFATPFVLIGCYSLFGRFFIDAKQRSKTFYGFTQYRAIIVSGLLGQRVKSLRLNTLGEVTLEERADRSGTIMLGPTGSHYVGLNFRRSSNTGEVAPSFEFIADARSVYDRLRDAQKKTALPAR
jgi:hypothetical protein